MAKIVVGSLEFLPFAEPHPASGDVLELAIPNPDYQDQLDAHRELLERNPFAQNMLVERFAPTFSDRGDQLLGADELCAPHSQLTFVVGYPFDGQFAVTVSAASATGFTRAELFTHLASVYSAMYEGATFSAGPRKLQTRVDSPRFGTAWHRLEELAVEHVLLEMRGGHAFAWISIGS